jgi:hypothetical protein
MYEDATPQHQLDEEAYRAAYLIVGFIQGTLTPQEDEELDHWIEASDHNMHLFEQLTDGEFVQETLRLFDELHAENPSPYRHCLDGMDLKGRMN